MERDASFRKGKFISFEGVDGVGKTTHIRLLADYLRSRGVEVITTREPGGTNIGVQLRSVLLHSRTIMCPSTELALMFADRAQHIEEKLLPALQEGKWVLTDRYIDSAEAYQGGGRKLGSRIVLILHKILCKNLFPDLTVLLISDVKATLSRARRRNLRSQVENGDESRFENEDDAFHVRVLRTFLSIAKREPKRVVTVDAADPITKVHKKIVGIVNERLFSEKPLSKPKTP